MTTDHSIDHPALSWPDGPERRAALGHRPEPHVPGYCTCGELRSRCETARIDDAGRLRVLVPAEFAGDEDAVRELEDVVRAAVLAKVAEIRARGPVPA